MGVDGQVDNMEQVECIHNIIRNNPDKLRNVKINIGDKTGNTKTTIKGDWIKQMLKMVDQDDIIERIQLNIFHVDMDDSIDDFRLSHIRNMRVHLHHVDDVVMISKLFNHITMDNLEVFVIYTNTEKEPEDMLRFVSRSVRF